MELDRSLDLLAFLGDPVRRSLYRHCRAAVDPVAREEAAEAVGISQKLAAFHLDKLVEAGLLVASFRPRPHRLGRPVKIYAPSDVELQVSIPERHYQGLAGILVGANSDSPAQRDKVLALARERGEDAGSAARAERRLGRPGPERTIAVTRELLAARGFEPHPDGEGGLWLSNCPYRAVADEAPELVCGINLAFIEGLVRGLGNQTVTVALSPSGGRCCVTLSPPRRPGSRLALTGRGSG